MSKPEITPEEIKNIQDRMGQLTPEQELSLAKNAFSIAIGNLVSIVEKIGISSAQKDIVIQNLTLQTTNLQTELEKLKTN